MMKLISSQPKWLAGLTILVVGTFLFGGCAQPNESPVISSPTANEPPIISSLTANEGWIAPAGISQVECIASDPNGNELSYNWSADEGNISGEDSVVTWTAPDVPGTYTITVEVTDGRGGEATMQLTIDVVAINHPPVIDSLTSEARRVTKGVSPAIECIASDQDGDSLSYIWSADGGNISGEGSVVTWTAPDAPGTYTITVEVTDGIDGEATTQLTIDVVAINHPPVIDSLTKTERRVRKKARSIIECVASDPDGDELSYNWSADEGNISGEGSVVTWTAPNTYGTYTITVTVTDGRGGEASESVTIIVCPCG